ncbi:MAG: geranylgeranylglycerol-phosphate geranylgeranyltransferase [Candidatus Aenigmarchaeota archaeon]|nr:geranylgeranylglycerol-phosphate geranylgeranyltransferase [Candidatus Aenigmarchaeota archaeon]
MSKNLVRGLVALIRPLNCFMAALAVPATFLFLAGVNRIQAFSKEMILGSLVVFFMCAGGNALNDLVDSRIDRINKPARPIPSRMVTKNQTLLFSFSLFLVSISAASAISKIVLISVVAGSMLLAFYDLFSKYLGILGNVIVAVILGAPFIVMGLISGEVHKSILVAIAAGSIIFGRELIKSIEDVKGDSIIGIHSFPAKYGKKKTASIASLSLIIGSIALVYLRTYYNAAYIIVLLFALYKFMGPVLQPLRMTTKKAGGYSKNIKAGIIIVILAVVLGSLF